MRRNDDGLGALRCATELLAIEQEDECRDQETSGHDGHADILPEASLHERRRRRKQDRRGRRFVNLRRRGSQRFRDLGFWWWGLHDFDDPGRPTIGAATTWLRCACR